MEKKTEVVKQEVKAVQVAQTQMPSEIIAMAINKGTDLDKVKQALEIQMIWEQNEARKAYHKAMAAFKSDPPQIDKDKTVKYKEVKYNHASLANVTEKINKALSLQGLSSSWKTDHNGKVSVTCKITHEKGHSEETTLSAPPDSTGSKNTIQAIGSTISYLQRYTLLALTGLATHDIDDDGKASDEIVIDDAQKHLLLDMIAATNTNMEKFLKYAKVETLDQLPKGKYAEVVAALDDKAKRGKA